MRRYEQLLEDYENAYFALLMDQVAKQKGERLEQQNQELIEDPNFEVPETTDQKCLRTIERCFARQQRQTALRSVTHILHYAAIIIAVSILVFTTAFAISEDFRVATRNLLVTVNERYTDFRMKIEDPSSNTSQASVSGQSSNGVGDASYFDHLVVGWIPEGFQLVRNEYNDWVLYQNSDGEWIQILFADDQTAVQLDTEDAEVSNSNISGLPAVIIDKNGRTSILLTDEKNGFFYIVITSSGIDFETSSKIAKNLII